MQHFYIPTSYRSSALFWCVWTGYFANALHLKFAGSSCQNFQILRTYIFSTSMRVVTIGDESSAYNMMIINQMA